MGRCMISCSRHRPIYWRVHFGEENCVGKIYWWYDRGCTGLAKERSEWKYYRDCSVRPGRISKRKKEGLPERITT